MRAVLFLLISLSLVFQYSLWRGEGGLIQQASLKHLVEKQKTENLALKNRNTDLETSVKFFKDGLEGIEDQARHKLGMIKKDETFFITVEN